MAEKFAPNETLPFAELAAWSKGRWLAGQHEASDNVMKRAVAQAKVEHDGKTVVRDTVTGDLNLVGKEEKK